MKLQTCNGTGAWNGLVMRSTPDSGCQKRKIPHSFFPGTEIMERCTCCSDGMADMIGLEPIGKPCEFKSHLQYLGD